jgi:hypothetical protein
MQEITFETLPKAVQTLLEQVEVLNQKIDKQNPNIHTPISNENEYLTVKEINQTLFAHWKPGTIYNKCCLGEIPHTKIGGKLMFNFKECREFIDKQIKQGKVKPLSQLQNEAIAFVETKMGGIV